MHATIAQHVPFWHAFNEACSTVDTPVTTAGMMLIWAAPERFDNVIVMLGDLHILFNFLKAIGQHVECAGLDDIWVDVGLFAQNSTPEMMDGKAYYRGVDTHWLMKPCVEFDGKSSKNG